MVKNWALVELTDCMYAERLNTRDVFFGSSELARAASNSNPILNLSESARLENTKFAEQAAFFREIAAHCDPEKRALYRSWADLLEKQAETQCKESDPERPSEAAGRPG